MSRLISQSHMSGLEVWWAEAADHVIALAWSPDQSRLAVAAASGEIAILDAAEGGVAGRLAGHSGGTLALGWQPCGSLLATAGQDCCARVWHADTGQCVAEFGPGARWVEHVAWAPNGKTLAAAGGKSVGLWTAQGDLRQRFDGHESTITALAWSPEGASLATACYGAARLLRPDDPAPPARLPCETSLIALAWSPDGRFLAAGTQDRAIHLWQMPRRRARAEDGDLEMSGYPLKVKQLAWDRHSRYLATGGGSEITVWDFSGRGPSGSRPKVLQGHGARLTTLTYQSRGALLASGDTEGRVLVWNLACRPPTRAPQPTNSATVDSEITQLAWSPKERYLAVGTHHGTVSLWKLG